VSFDTGDTIEITALDVAQGGWCVARPDDGPVVFVRHALPGERVRARVTEVTSRFARADAVEILDPSPERIEAPCPSARPGGCGGCDWQHASLPAQRALKAAVVMQQLRRLAGIDREVTVEALPGDEDEAPGAGLGWRTRVQFAVRPDGRAGLRAHRSHEVIDVGDCLIAHPAIRNLGIPKLSWQGAESVEAITTGSERAVIATRRSGGAGRDAAIRSGGKDAGGMAAVTAEAVLSRAGRRLTPVRGGPYLRQRAAGRDWRISAGSFWQVHPAAAETLTAAVLAAVEPKSGDVVLDLYCGAGLFAGALAPLVGPGGAVVGIESDDAAVRDARHNLRDMPWARVRRGDVARVLRHGRPGGREAGRGRLAGEAPSGPVGRGSTAGAGWPGENRGLPPARLVVADPPRAGLARSVIDDLSSGEAERFAYVSCDPATLARDLGLLLARGWRLEGLRAFDAFPMTHHVECVASLAR
jgi:tRNA/tmRNA/rRNA uracil-C5-methylase (TrmA/RlmC/RlmD family)